jgi:hypothetical protein
LLENYPQNGALSPAKFSRTDFLAWQTAGNAHILLFDTVFVDGKTAGTTLRFIRVF